ncbi:MAG: TIGR04283 family arsenosugar biosynthesis glycosyltransferase [Planctomycetota bacterium]|jgi:rSAM/selenodomain-associated transferase 2
MKHTRRKLSEYKFSIIVPVLNEQGQINSFIDKIKGQDFDGTHEIIVVDGDPHGGTIKVVQDSDVICLNSARGRGRRMNIGAARASGDTLLFLHADTRLPQGALKKIVDVLENPKYVGGAFDLCIDSNRWILKYISARASWRSRLNRIPYGDQAIFMRKNYFEKIGGFRDIPLMEDVDLMRRIKKDGKEIHILRDKVVTSARRWENEGAVYTTLRNQVIVMLYYLGVSPHKLAKLYKFGSNGQVSKQKSIKWENKKE